MSRAGGIAQLEDEAVVTMKEYPEPKSFLDQLLGGYKKSMSAKAMKDQLGEEGYKTWNTIRKLKASVGVGQAKLPFDLSIE